MDGFGPSTYGDGFAAVYDRWYHDVTDTEACVEALARLARTGAGAGADRRPRVLELGAGTGRLALPLAADGLDVTALDASREMLDRLDAKLGAAAPAAAVTTVLGDMADLDSALPSGATFDVAFAAYNTLFNVPTADDQVRCVAAVAARLRPGGRFVVEAFVPADEPDARRDSVAVSRIDPTELVLNATLHDPDDQTIIGQHVQITEAGVRLRPWFVRYLWPAQLDELAAASGLELESRAADWDATPFDDTSAVHVSVYRRPP